MSVWRNHARCSTPLRGSTDVLMVLALALPAHLFSQPTSFLIKIRQTEEVTMKQIELSYGRRRRVELLQRVACGRCDDGGAPGVFVFWLCQQKFAAVLPDFDFEFFGVGQGVPATTETRCFCVAGAQRDDRRIFDHTHVGGRNLGATVFARRHRAIAVVSGGGEIIH